MGASLVKKCWIADDVAAYETLVANNRRHSRQQSAHRQQSTHTTPTLSHSMSQRSISGRAPQHQHHRILPPQPGQQPYEYYRHPRKLSQYELQQQQWYAMERMKHRSPIKGPHRERWDSRESTCSSSASTTDEEIISMSLDGQRRRQRHSSRHPSSHIHHGSFDDRHGSISSGSTPASSTSRRSRVSSPSCHQELLPAHYILEDLVGSGTTSKVYRCRRTTDNRVFACKIINKRRLAFDAHHRDDMAQQLRREVDILKSLDHPHIAKLEDSFENDTYIILLMEYLEGGELFETIIDRVRLTEAEAKHVAKCVLSAITYIHSKGIVHRDLKPENLLLASKPTPGAPLHVKIIDFGFAATTKAAMTSVLGTGGYLAPEIVMQRPYNAAVDTWSFGVLVYLMLCGRLPFTTATQIQPGQRLSALYRLSFPEKYWDGVSSTSKDLLKKLLVLNPSYRLPPADALRHRWFQPTA